MAIRMKIRYDLNQGGAFFTGMKGRSFAEGNVGAFLNNYRHSLAIGNFSVIKLSEQPHQFRMTIMMNDVVFYLNKESKY